MIRKVLIPNRGEIAVRIIKAAHELGIKTVVTLSELENNTIPAQISDEVHYFKEGPFSENYLNIPLIIDLALKYKADSIHPGYGFLAENYLLAEACTRVKITFIGPSSNHLKQMGDKQLARTIARQCGIPLIPTWEGTPHEISAQSGNIIFPVLIKAAMGGGGKGMFICHNHSQLKEQLTAAARQSQRYFGDKRVYAEQYLEISRHIEVQVLADDYGNTLHLFERECSVQRRFQKIIEEAPAPNLSEAQRDKITGDALKMCKAIGYKNAGTLEFLVDNEGKHYFLEMNTRIQVEHGITEEITGIDLVKWQFKIAEGTALSLQQKDIEINGHAIEARIYAEDPENNFRPSPGKITNLIFPAPKGFRSEMAFDQLLTIHPQFDPMIAKYIVHKPSREEAINALSNKLNETVLTGIHSNTTFLQSVLKHPAYRNGQIHTRFCEDQHEYLTARDQNLNNMAFLTYALIRFNKSKGINGYWRLHPSLDFQYNDQQINATYRKLDQTLLIKLNDVEYEAYGLEIDPNKLIFNTDNQKHTAFYFQNNEYYTIIINNQEYRIKAMDILPEYIPAKSINKPVEGTTLLSPLPGQVSKILVSAGQEVKEGDVLIILEAMKMENHLSAWKDSIIEQVHIENGDTVQSNQLLITTK